MSERLKTSRSISPHFIVDKKIVSKVLTLESIKRRRFLSFKDETTKLSQDQPSMTSRPHVRKRMLKPFRSATDSEVPKLKTARPPCPLGDQKSSKEHQENIFGAECSTENLNQEKVMQRINRMLHFKKAKDAHLFTNQNHLKVRLAADRGQPGVYRQKSLVDDQSHLSQRLHLSRTLQSKNKFKGMDSSTKPEAAELAEKDAIQIAGPRASFSYQHPRSTDGGLPSAPPGALLVIRSSNQERTIPEKRGRETARSLKPSKQVDFGQLGKLLAPRAIKLGSPIDYKEPNEAPEDTCTANGTETNRPASSTSLTMHIKASLGHNHDNAHIKKFEDRATALGRSPRPILKPLSSSRFGSNESPAENKKRVRFNRYREVARYSYAC